MIRSTIVSAKSEPNGAELELRLAHLEAELCHERRISSVLREVGLAIGSVADLDQILELILSKITEVLDADRATLYLLDEANGELVSRVVVGESVQTIHVQVGKGIAGMVARTGKPIRVRDAYRDKRFMRDWDILTGYRTRSILAAPMKNHLGRIIGVVQALNKRGGEEDFTEEDESLLMALATHAAVTVDNSRLYLSAIQKNVQLVEIKEQLEHRVRDLNLLFNLESSMARAGTMEDLLHAALSEATRACDARAAAVMLPAEGPADDGRVRADGASASMPPGMATVYFFESGERDDKLRTVLMRPADGFVGSVFSSGNAAVSVQVAHNTPGGQKLDEALGFQTDGAVGAPLEGQDGDLIGAIALYNKDDARGFTPDDMNLLRLIAANVSTAVQLFRSRVAQERAERLTTIGRLLSGVIHDLKTPMTVISGYVQLMVAADDPKVRGEYSELVLRQFDFIQQMQREVLEFARGERTILIRRVYLQHFMRGFEQSLQHELEGTPVGLRVDVDDRGVARFDEGKITRALHNLVRNALEAMGEKGGKLTVRVRREGGAVIFSVADTGPGIPKEIQGRLFESFVTAGKKGGTGLGLAIVKKIVDEHGGTLDVITSHKGTTFSFTLPQKE
jgi:signal transduction histidine kinase/putative methionine-R-sulfoxide reductase with GAF domain